MNRPSHWILASLVLLGGALWATGAIDTYLGEEPRVFGEQVEPVVVRRENAPVHRPTASEVRGRVVDRYGWPVFAAGVSVVGAEAEGLDAKVVRTDGDGRFSLEVPGASRHRLRIEARGRHQTEEVDAGPEELLVVMQDALPWATETAHAHPPQSGMLMGEGYLKDAEGRHIPFGRVTVRESGACALADDTGRFSIPLPTGDFTLVAYDDQGRVDVSDTVHPSRTQGKVPLPELRLEPGLRLSGYVVDPDGEPCQGATLVLENAGIRRPTISGPGGFFDLGGLVSGPSKLVAMPHLGDLGFEMKLDLGGDSDLGDLSMVRHGILRLRILDRSAMPVARAHVVAEESEQRRAYGQADETGEVVLAGLGAGPYKFEVRSDDAYRAIAVDDFDPAQGELVVSGIEAEEQR